MNKLEDKLSIREKRTFVCNMKCECGGDYHYESSANDVVDIFASLFGTANSTSKYKHACSKCKKVNFFENIYPLIKEFEIGLDTPNDKIAEFVGQSFSDTIQDDVKNL